MNPVIQSYMGESRGRWENGNTLVITTTNIKPGASMTNIGIAGSPAGNRIPTSDQLKLTERITRLGKDMIEYELTVEDPVVLTRPWTMRMPLKEEPTYEWWEYACHEGNSVIPNYVNTSRAERAAARPAAPHRRHPAPAPAVDVRAVGRASTVTAKGRAHARPLSVAGSRLARKVHT